MEELQLQPISSAALEAQEHSALDVQITTAKAYPRNLSAVLNEIKTTAAMDPQTAADCFYCLSRQGSNIEGLSVRMAEIMVNAFGNIFAASRIINNDGKCVTAQAICWDLEKNVRICTEVSRRITDKQGRTYSEDMQTTTKNAACSIAFRNAVLKVIPKAITKRVVDEVKLVAAKQAIDITSMRQRIIDWYSNKGVKEATLLEYYQIASREELDNEKLLFLNGLANAIHDGDTTIEESIIQPIRERKAQELANKKAETNLDAVAQAMNKQK